MPKREIFDRSNFPDFYTVKSSWVGELLVKILLIIIIFERAKPHLVSDAHAEPVPYFLAKTSLKPP